MKRVWGVALATALVLGMPAAAPLTWAQEGQLIPLGTLTGEGSSWATGVSREGTVVVGYHVEPSTIGSSSTPWRWTAETGMVPMATLGGTFYPGGVDATHRAEDVSDDGRVAVGWSAGPLGRRAVRWGEGGSIQDLGVLVSTPGARTPLKPTSPATAPSSRWPGGRS